MVDVLPEGAVVLTKEFQVFSPWLSLHHVDDLRSDVTVVDTLLVMRSWYLDHLRQVLPPKIAQGVRAEEMAYRAQLALFEGGQEYNGNNIQATYIAYLTAILLRASTQGRDVFYLPQFGVIEEGLSRHFAWIPFGLAYKGIVIVLLLT